jgi:hypothetical protein
MTLNIMLNLELVEQINNTINANRDKKDISLSNKVIKKDRKNPKEDVPYVFKNFGDEQFDEYYFKLINSAITGNITSYHDLSNIKNCYINLRKYKKKNISYEQIYIITMNLLIKVELDELSHLSIDKKMADLPFIFLDTKTQLNKLKMAQNRLELDIELLEKFLISLDYRVEYEFRRKIGNLISNKIINNFENKLEIFSKTEYLLALSVEDIESKIEKVLKYKDSDEKKKSLKELTITYNKALTLLKEHVSKKLNASEARKILKLDRPQTLISFKNITTNNKDIDEVVILNLYFIIKKKMGVFFNDHIHNKSVFLNNLAKAALDKYEGEKDLKNNEDLFKIGQEEENLNMIPKNDKTINIRKEINSKIQNEDNQFHKDKICEKMKIIEIKKNIKIEDTAFAQRERII